MKLRGIAVLSAAVLMIVAGCGDDITNIIEEVVPTQAPVTNTPAPPTNTPLPTATPDGNTPTVTSTPDGTVPPSVCGNGVVEGAETCDIGGICVGGDNDLDPCTAPGECPGGECTVVGGQPAPGGSCAANCTLESIRTAQYGEGTSASVQAVLFRVPVPLSGSQTIQTGAPRADETIDINGNVTFRPGDLPLITKAPDIRINPAPVPGLVCACVRGIEVPAFGAGNSATGLISCGGELEDIDYLMSQDHRTDPRTGFVVNAECSHAPDPECDEEVEIVKGVVSLSCREGEGENCLDHPHIAGGVPVCNSPRQVAYSGSGPVGSAIIFNNTAIGLLSDSGVCDMGIAGMSPCPRADYGPDCVPCTGDDLDFGVPENNPTTTGLASAAVYNANNTTRSSIIEGTATDCEMDDDCTERTCGVQEVCIARSTTDPTAGRECNLRCGGLPCKTTRQGTPFDCDALMSNPTGGLEGGAFAVCFPSVDAATIGDNVTCTTFAFD